MSNRKLISNNREKWFIEILYPNIDIGGKKLLYMILFL